MQFLDWIITRGSGMPSPAPLHQKEEIPPPEPASRIDVPSTPQPVVVPTTRYPVAKEAFLSNPSLPLVQISHKDYLKIRDAFAGIHIFGSNGSGKTTGSGQTLAKAYLRAGWGGLVLCAKPDEAENWQRYAKACGRAEQVIVISPDNPWRFNFIQYEMHRPGDPATRVENLLATLMTLVEQGGRNQAGGGQDQFWFQAAEQLLRYSLMILSAAYSHYSLFDLQQFIDTTPLSPDDAQNPAFADSTCGKTLAQAKEAYLNAERMADFRVIENYFLNQFPRLADKTRSSITITLSTMLQDLLTGTMRELFSTGCNVFPEDTHEGAIIILDLPTIQNRAHISAQILFKTVWQQAALRRMYLKDHHMRPIFLWADESHFFATEFDTGYQSLARQAKACTVYLTQNLSAYYQRIGGKDPEKTTHAFLGYLPTQIFHANNDPNTIRYMIELFGEYEVKRHNSTYSHSSGENWSENRSNGSSFSVGHQGSSESTTSGFNQSNGWSEGYSENTSMGYNESSSIEKMLRAHHITSLTTGSDDVDPSQKHLRGISQAWIFRNGSIWSNGLTHMLGQFDRRLT